MHKLYQCCRNSLLSSWEEGHVAKSKVQMEAGRARTEGSRYYGNIGRADALVLQLCCVLQTAASSGEGEARCRFGQYRGAGAGGRRVGSCYTFNEPWPGCSQPGRGIV